MRELRGKLALVTGAASGIGREIAFALARQGTNLWLVDVDEAGLESATQAIRAMGVSATACVCDLAQPEAIDRLVDHLVAQECPLDILVNNAGVAYYGPTEAMRDSQWDHLLSVNLLAPLHLVRRLLPMLLSRPESHILNVASVAGLVGSSRLTAYNVTKFGLVGLSESLRAEFGARGLGVSVLCPGLVATKLLWTAMNGRPDRPLPHPPRWACSSPEAVAARAIRAIRHNQGLVVISLLAHLLWTLKRISPWLLDFLQRLRLRRRRRPKAASTAENNDAGPTAIGAVQRATVEPAHAMPPAPLGGEATAATARTSGRSSV